jgi:hypothetical protein
VSSRLSFLGICVSTCGGSSSSTTTPTPTPPSTTRVIGLSGNLAFGDVAAGSTATSVLLTITNTGNASLTVTGVSPPSAGSGIYTASWTSGTIPTGGSQAVTIRFAPAAAISYSGTLTVSADQTSGAPTIILSFSHHPIQPRHRELLDDSRLHRPGGAITGFIEGHAAPRTCLGCSSAR